MRRERRVRRHRSRRRRRAKVESLGRRLAKVQGVTAGHVQAAFRRGMRAHRRRRVVRQNARRANRDVRFEAKRIHRQLDAAERKVSRPQVHRSRVPIRRLQRRQVPRVR